MICAGTDLQLLPVVCTDEMTRSVVVVSCHVVSQLLDVFHLAGGSSVVFLLRACIPPKYFRPVNTRDSCFALTRNLSQASFVVPSLKYFRDSFSHTAAVRILVGPLRGSCFRQVALGTGNTVCFTFSLFSSSDDGAFLSSSGFKNPSGMFNCTRGHTAPFMTVINVVLSVIFAVLLYLHTPLTDVGALGPHVRKCL